MTVVPIDAGAGRWWPHVHIADGTGTVVKDADVSAFVLKFLAGYTPRFLCVPCLAVLMVREESEVVPVIAACVINGAVETRIDGEFCLNCLKLTYAVRINRHAGPDAVLTLTLMNAADERP